MEERCFILTPFLFHKWFRKKEKKIEEVENIHQDEAKFRITSEPEEGISSTS